MVRMVTSSNFKEIETFSVEHNYNDDKTDMSMETFLQKNKRDTKSDPNKPLEKHLRQCPRAEYVHCTPLQIYQIKSLSSSGQNCPSNTNNYVSSFYKRKMPPNS